MAKRGTTSWSGSLRPRSRSKPARGRTKKRNGQKNRPETLGRTGDDVPRSSTIIEYLRDNQNVIDYLDTRKPWWTSTICVFEVLNGPAESPTFDPIEERQAFSGIQAFELNEQPALEAARLQNASITDGNELSHRDTMIAATARSTGDEYVVADSDFETAPLQDVMEVTNLHAGD